MPISVEVAQFAASMDALHDRSLVAVAAIAAKLTTAPPVISAEDAAELTRVLDQSTADTVATEALAAPVIPVP